MVTRYDLKWITTRITGGETDRRPPLGLTLLSGAIAATVLSPIVWLLLRTINMGIERALELLVHPSTIQVLLNSIALVIAVTTTSVLLGVPLAVLTVQTSLPFRRVWTILIALPLVIPSYIGAFAYVSAFGPRGDLADILSPLGIEEIPSIYGFGGAVLVLTLYVYPYVFLTTRAALLSFDMTLFDAARTLNQTPWGAFRRITVPQIMPGIAAGALLVALYTLSDFGTPAIMHADVLTSVIYVEYNTFARDAAALLSLQLLALTVLILAIESRIQPGNRTAYVSRGVRGMSEISLGRWTAPALMLCSTVALLTIGIPLGILFVWLFRTSPGDGGIGSGFAFQWAYGWNSVYVSVLAAIVAIVLAIPVAYLSARSQSWLATVFNRATYVGYAVPGIVLGLSLVYFGVTYAPTFYQTLPLLIFAYVVRFLPQAVGTTQTSVLQVDPTLVEAARTLGHSSTGAFRRVTLPLIVPGVVAGATLVFLTTMKELPATLLLHPTGFDTLVTYIWLVQSAGYYDQAALPALVLVGVSGLSMLILLTQEATDAE
ncbi:ABC transporter permease [Haladaptatus salinisoli]|uniref:ABC transporter permease n=1 Tax=Haladaptatus salinisoli TaxID=2884876 RepID=UPI001D0BC27F|nr:iron ABC transporter permease [Haladaptatus salinisoli]